MKNTKFSSTQRKILRVVIALILIQIAIIVVLGCMLESSKQVDASDLKRIDITVDDVYDIKITRESWLIVESDSTKYLFTGLSTYDECSVDELYESIQKGDKLSLMYQETYNILGKVNLVVDARSEFGIYRSIDEHNEGKHGLVAFVLVMFAVIEFFFAGIALVYVWIHYSTFREIFRRIKKDHIGRNNK